MEYPYGHPFWLGKPPREEVFIDSGYLGLLELFQSGHVFLNGLRGTPAHPDSYMTVIDFNRFDAVFALLTQEYAISPDEWIAFANIHINHSSPQPVTTLMGRLILSKFSV